MPLAVDDYKDEGSDNLKGGYANYSEVSSRDSQTHNYGSNSKMETIQDRKVQPDNKFRAEGTLTWISHRKPVFVNDCLIASREILSMILWFRESDLNFV